MQLTKREQMLVSLLRVRPRTGSELAEALAVSRRTVMREVSSVNAKLVAQGAARIESGQSYSLEVVSEDVLCALLNDGLSDELAVLLCALTSSELSVSSLAQETFLSRRAVAMAIEQINREYAGVVHLEPRAGRGVEVTLFSASAPDVLASLAFESPYLEARLEEMAAWEHAAPLIEDACARYLGEVRPYLSSRQAHLQAVAAMASAPFARKQSANWAVARLEEAGAFFDQKRNLLFDLLRHHAAIVEQIEVLLRTYGIRSSGRSDLCQLVFDHVVRCALFPTLMSGQMREQMRDMRMRHPFEFDFGDDLCARLSEKNPSLLLEPEFLALYLLASTEEDAGQPVTILVVCSRRSMSTINRRLIEQNVENADVCVVADGASAAALLAEGGWDLTVRDEDSPVLGEGISWDLQFRGVLGSEQLRIIRCMALDIRYQKNVTRMLREENYFHLHNKSAEQPYLAVLEDVLDVLVGAHRITSDEAELIRRRERAGKRLNLKGFAFPHTVTPVESNDFRMFVICLDEPVVDMDTKIEIVVVILASQSQADKSSIFPYLLSVIEGAGARGESLPRDYASTVRFLGGTV